MAGFDPSIEVFDAFVRLPEGSTLVTAWAPVTLEPEAFALASHLAGAVGYLGRAESWTECEALAEWNGDPNCRPLDGSPDGDRVRLLAPQTPDAYAAERQRIMDDMRRRLFGAPGRRPTERALEKQLDKALKSKSRQAHTLPERLVDALALDTAAGALLDIVLPEAIEGPLAIGYGSHFGLGLFAADDDAP